MCCGSRRQIGRDHVPPKVLFGRPLPSNLITVPACWRCNQIFSKDDEYFASILSIENSAHRQPQAAERWERFVRGLQRPRAAQFRTACLKNLKPIDLYTEGGVYLGRRGGVEINFDRIIRTVCRCVRGLYYPEEKRSIRENRKILTFAIEGQDPQTVASLNSILEPLAAVAPKDQWDGVFKYTYKLASDSIDVGAFLIQFYDAKL